MKKKPSLAEQNTPRTKRIWNSRWSSYRSDYEEDKAKGDETNCSRAASDLDERWAEEIGLLGRGVRGQRRRRRGGRKRVGFSPARRSGRYRRLAMTPSPPLSWRKRSLRFVILRKSIRRLNRRWCITNGTTNNYS